MSASLHNNFEDPCIHDIWPATACRICNGKDEKERKEQEENERFWGD